MTTRLGARAADGALVVAFGLCVVLANWAVMHFGADNGPDQPRTVPLGFGLHAPSGVLFAGVLFTLRDLLQERVGAGRTFLVVVATAPLTAVASAPSVALASIVTFLIAEVADWGIYTRVRPAGRAAAVVVSNVISTPIDSVLFLTMAFAAAPDLREVVGMTLGKFAASVVAVAPIVLATRRRAASLTAGLAGAERTRDRGTVAT